MEYNAKKVEQLIRDLLITLGENPERAGLVDTPRRVAQWWEEFLWYDPGTLDTCFESVSVDQMVIVSGMRVWSLCEHHLLPFWCDVAVGYIAEERVLGLSKFARIAQKYAHCLQLQERLCDQIAGEVESIVGSSHVAVLTKGQHLCMQMRGVKTCGTMISSVMRGRFRSDATTRMEFLQLVGTRE